MAAVIRCSSGSVGSGVATVTGKNLLSASSYVNLLAVSPSKECLKWLILPHHTSLDFPFMILPTVFLDRSLCTPELKTLCILALESSPNCQPINGICGWWLPSHVVWYG